MYTKYLPPWPKIFIKLKIKKKSEMHWITPECPWTLNSQSVPIYTLISTTESQICALFAVRPTVFEIQDCCKPEKSDMYGMTSDWPLTLRSQYYLVYTEFTVAELGHPTFFFSKFLSQDLEILSQDLEIIISESRDNHLRISRFWDNYLEILR